MASRGPTRIIALGVILVAAGIGGYLLWRPGPTAPVVGVVRTTEVRVAPEVGGQLAAINVQKGARVRAGDVVAELFALELIASVAQARAPMSLRQMPIMLRPRQVRPRRSAPSRTRR